MPASQQEDDFEDVHGNAASLLRLEVRYLRRDIQSFQQLVKDDIAKLASEKANRIEIELNSEAVKDHEARLRMLERRIYWATGFGGACGGVLAILSRLLLHV